MGLINYTGSITLRDTKGSALTFEELDTNFGYLNSGSIGGTYLPFQTITPLITNNGDGFGNILIGNVSPSMSLGITSSQVVTLDRNAASNEIKFVTASISDSGSFLGVALETKGPTEEIRILTEGYFGAYWSGATPPNQGYLTNNVSIAGTPVFFSGSYVTFTKPGTAVTTRPLGFCMNSSSDPDGIKYIKFSPSSFTLN